MPKVKCSDSAKLLVFVQEFGEQHFITDENAVLQVV
jgi:hypothetical protein